MKTLKLSTLYLATYVYLAIPLCTFLLSWLDYPIALLTSILFLGNFYLCCKNIERNEQQWSVPCSVIYCIILVAVLWCFFAGIGYFYYQSWDYHFRNAVFRDLINYDWPVMYDKANTPMVYYMGFWLLPSLLGKFLALCSVSAKTTFFICNIFLFFYAVIGVSIIFLYLTLILKLKNVQSLLWCLGIFIFFSGMDVIGHVFFRVTEPPFAYHLDWWATFIQYSSITTSMFWVFNQFIPTTLVVLCIYSQCKTQNFGFLLICLLFLAPYPAVSTSVLMGVCATWQLIGSSDKKKFMLQEIFSISNIVSIVGILPIIVLYFITNSEGIDRWRYIFEYTTLPRFFLFMVLEFLLYILILYKSFRHDVFFNTMVFLLIFVPFLRVDQQNNFCMRASMPAIMLLALFCIRFLHENIHLKKISSGLLILLILIGSATPIMEFYRGFHYIAEAKKINLVKDDIYTLNRAYVRMPDFGWDANHQYTARHYQTDIFWQYLAKKHSPFLY